MRRAALAVLVLLVACGPGPGGGSEEEVTVVASFYPIAETAVRVAGDRGAVTNLTPPGAEPHDLELTSRDVDAVLDADVVLYLGHGFQPALEEVVGQAEGVTVDLLEGVDLRRAESDPHEEEGDEHADEEAGEALDPHVWLDPERMLDIVDRVEAALAEADPEGADTYSANAETYREEIRALDEEYEEGLAGCERDVIVTAHAAFGYLADRYGLRQEAVSGISPEAEPDPRRLDELATEVQEEGITTIFTETLVSPEVAQTLAREVGVRIDVLNPLEGLTEEQEAAGETYVSVMRDNLERLRAALGCA